ncbi:hypothetical protein HDU96_002758, partial [Phlyctochytrium bullatum]
VLPDKRRLRQLQRRLDDIDCAIAVVKKCNEAGVAPDDIKKGLAFIKPAYINPVDADSPSVLTGKIQNSLARAERFNQLLHALQRFSAAQLNLAALESLPIDQQLSAYRAALRQARGYEADVRNRVFLAGRQVLESLAANSPLRRNRAVAKFIEATSPTDFEDDFEVLYRACQALLPLLEASIDDALEVHVGGDELTYEAANLLYPLRKAPTFTSRPDAEGFFTFAPAVDPSERPRFDRRPRRRLETVTAAPAVDADGDIAIPDRPPLHPDVAAAGNQRQEAPPVDHPSAAASRRYHQPGSSTPRTPVATPVIDIAPGDTQVSLLQEFGVLDRPSTSTTRAVSPAASVRSGSSLGLSALTLDTASPPPTSTSRAENPKRKRQPPPPAALPASTSKIKLSPFCLRSMATPEYRFLLLGHPADPQRTLFALRFAVPTDRCRGPAVFFPVLLATVRLFSGSLEVDCSQSAVDASALAASNEDFPLALRRRGVDHWPAYWDALVALSRPSSAVESLVLRVGAQYSRSQVLYFGPVAELSAALPLLEVLPSSLSMVASWMESTPNAVSTADGSRRSAQSLSAAAVQRPSSLAEASTLPRAASPVLSVRDLTPPGASFPPDSPVVIMPRRSGSFSPSEIAPLHASPTWLRFGDVDVAIPAPTAAPGSAAAIVAPLRAPESKPAPSISAAAVAATPAGSSASSPHQGRVVAANLSAPSRNAAVLSTPVANAPGPVEPIRSRHRSAKTPGEPGAPVPGVSETPASSHTAHAFRTPAPSLHNRFATLAVADDGDDGASSSTSTSSTSSRRRRDPRPAP